ncbi:M16 family metallopeptidase [Pseudochelatococcus lubricantis]|uniref:M16 family metallopeptidase n=1 Tax=Pseudochelatococcus lubricantis TaxID=1538102 RepID=UPI0035ED5ED6
MTSPFSGPDSSGASSTGEGSISAAGQAAGTGTSLKAGPEVVTRTLANGLDVVVIPDRRVPVVTHMVWYRNGSGDDPLRKSGIAHFLEHLMFKGTATHPAGEFSHLVASLGGQENAFTSYDYTAYYQRIAKEHLGTMMAFESDRMTGLTLDDAAVDPERLVVLEERRMRTDTDPSAQLSEALAATLYTHNPYGTPIIGWQHEIETLDRHDALAYYRRFYTPENAILVVAGDVEADEVIALAESTYGRIAARGERPQRQRPREPLPVAMKRVSVADARVEQPYLQRAWLVPSVRTQTGQEAYALELLAEILGGGPTSLLYRHLVLDQGVAVNAGASYHATMLDDSRFDIYAVPASGVTLDALDEAVGKVVTRLVEDGVNEAELTRARTRFVSEMIYAQDSQVHMAHIYGSALAIGETVADVQQWTDRIEAVDAGAIQEAARRFLSRPHTSGFLLPA